MIDFQMLKKIFITVNDKDLTFAIEAEHIPAEKLLMIFYGVVKQLSKDLAKHIKADPFDRKRAKFIYERLIALEQEIIKFDD